MRNQSLAKVINHVVCCEEREDKVLSIKTFILQLIRACWYQRDRARKAEQYAKDLQGQVRYLETNREYLIDIIHRLGGTLDERL